MSDAHVPHQPPVAGANRRGTDWASGAILRHLLASTERQDHLSHGFSKCIDPSLFLTLDNFSEIGMIELQSDWLESY